MPNRDSKIVVMEGAERFGCRRDEIYVDDVCSLAAKMLLPSCVLYEPGDGKFTILPALAFGTRYS